MNARHQFLLSISEAFHAAAAKLKTQSHKSIHQVRARFTAAPHPPLGDPDRPPPPTHQKKKGNVVYNRNKSNHSLG